MKRIVISLFALLFLLPLFLSAQKKKADESTTTSVFKSSTFSGLKWRSIGPAMASGRISDFAVNTSNTKEYYVAVSSGHVWKTTNMGLKESRQIGGIIVHPRNPDIVFVAAEGSVWGPGGERGLYKTTDGGKTWNRVLEISENTGVNNVVIDTRNPGV